jgi:hypothetical protein|tara:strand:+ start:1800 stop:3260 length:1461 start_codon:yes stop_codon:yes gene_type:complete
MESFRKTLIAEAAFNVKSLVTVVDKIKIILERRVSEKFYQYGGEDGAQEFKKTKTGAGVGILFLIGDRGKAVRLNWEKKDAKQAQITSVDYWESWNTEFPWPTRTIHGLQYFNIVHLVNVIADFIKAPAARELKVTIDEAAGTLDMASVARAAYHEYGNSEVKVSDLKDIARKLGRKVNQYQLSKLPRGKRGTVNVTMLLDTEVGENETVSDDPAQKKIELAAEKVPIDVLFQDLGDLVDLVLSNTRPALLITGGGGTGKTFTVKARIKNAGMTKADYKISKGATSVFGLYQEFFLARKGKLVVFDDNDDVFKDMTSQNLLKAALDSYDEREISWSSKQTIPIDQSLPRATIDMIEDGIEQNVRDGVDPETGHAARLPNTFEFKGRVIFISNLPQGKIPQPVLSRSLTIDVTLSPGEMMERMQAVISVIAKETGVSEEEAKMVLNKLKELADAKKISQPTMRTLPAAINIMKSGMPRWEKLLKYAA